MRGAKEGFRVRVYKRRGVQGQGMRGVREEESRFRAYEEREKIEKARTRPMCKVTPVILHGVVSSGDTTPCRMTGVTLRGVVSPEGWGICGAREEGKGAREAPREPGTIKTAKARFWP